MSTSPRGFYIGLVVIVLGVGLLKPNVSAIVADLYPEGGARLDSGFTVFYIGINVGGLLGPLITGLAQQYFGLRAGFAAAAFFMAVGVLQFYFTRRHLGAAGTFIAAAGADGLAVARPWRQFWSAAGLSALVLAAVTAGWIPVNPVALARVAAYADRSAWRRCTSSTTLSPRGSTAEERRRGVVLVVLFFGMRLFFSGYEQAGSSLNLFAERYTDRADRSAALRDSHRLVSVAEFGLHHHLRAVLRVDVDRARAAQSESVGAGEVRARRHVDGLGIPGHGGGGRRSSPPARRCCPTG